MSSREIIAPKIFLSAGEASGEHYGALLIAAVRKLHPNATFFGLGGQRMEALGCKLIVRAEDVAVMGITEVIRHMPRLYGEYRKLKRSLREQRPDVGVLIDFPDINLQLAAELHRLRIPVIFFVSPQLWAWKKHRIRQVRRYVDRMLVIFPFEEAFYRDRHVEATYVGHPLADLPLPAISREDFAAKYALDPSKQWVGLLPGSREKEIRLNLPVMVKSASRLGSEYEFLLPLAPTLSSAHIGSARELLNRELLTTNQEASQEPDPETNHDRQRTAPPRALRITLVSDARSVLHHARASIVASGTATIEAALIGNPFIVVYRVSRLTYAVAKHFVKVPFVAMVNLIAGRAIVPELIQDDFSAHNVVLHMRILLGNDADSEGTRQIMKNDLRRVAEQLRADRNHPSPATSGAVPAGSPPTRATTTGATTASPATASAIARVAGITSAMLQKSVAQQPAPSPSSAQ